MGAFHKLQPRDGDTVLHCGHVKGSSRNHFWRLPHGVPFERPDGTSGKAGWIVACDPCAQASGMDPLAVAIVGDARWNGDAPAIRTAN